MTNVHFIVTGSPATIEYSEDTLAHALRDNAPLVTSLCEQHALDGALVIGDTPLFDDLTSATQRLCFDSIEKLEHAGARYEYLYFTQSVTVVLETSADGSTITLSGDPDEVPTPQQFPRDELLRALYACGMRYMALLEELGKRGRRVSTYQLDQLRPYAEKAHSVLAARNLL